VQANISGLLYLEAERWGVVQYEQRFKTSVESLLQKMQN